MQDRTISAPPKEKPQPWVKGAAKAFPALYCQLFPELVEIANFKGWALAIHGSIQRDLDLVAVPWVESASPEQELVDAFVEQLAGVLAQHRAGTAAPKPHGRRAYTIILRGGAFIDLSVMPRTA